MTRPLAVEIPPHVAERIRHLPPEIKQRVRDAIRALAEEPELGLPLVRDLEGLWRYRVRRYRIIYEIDRKARRLRIMAVGHRSEVYEALPR